MKKRRKKNNPDLPPKMWRKVISDSDVRRTIVQESHLLFFHVYFPHYVTHEIAPFQREIFALTEDKNLKIAVIEAFRNSGKTTIISQSFTIWAILGKLQCKFVVLLAQTQQQARQYLRHIKHELETNVLLRKDLGPFEEPDDEWRSVSIVLPKYDARIVVASVDQSIRGIRHGPHRPDLIIGDDLEDLNSVRTRDGRNKLYDWLMGDIIPLGDLHTRLFIIGTRLHEDSLIMRMRRLIEDGKLNGIARAYPLLDQHGNIAWAAKYPDLAAVELLKKGMDERAFRREFLLEIVGDTDQVIEPSWIQRYDALPSNDHFLFTMTAIDLAISESERADFTAMVSCRIYIIDDISYFYILPGVVNQRLQYPDILARANHIINMVHKRGGYVVAEDVAFQRAFIQDMRSYGANVIGFRPGGLDKRARLALTAGKVKAGHVLLPRESSPELDQLISQITHFGQERHDDLADAFSMLIIEGAEKSSHRPSVMWLC